jgi:hypothetical protein
LEDYYHTNPFCDYQNALISFRDSEKPDNRISFLLGFKKTYTLPPNQPTLTNVQTEIVKRFVKEIPEELMVLFKQRYFEAKAYGEKNPMSYLEFESGRFFTFVELFPKGNKPIEFSADSAQYLIEDSYDIDPNNKNRTVKLAFFKLDLEEENKPPIFNYAYYFNEDLRVAEDKKIPDDHSALVVALNACVPNLRNMLKDRYREAKNLGEELLRKSA